MSEEDQIIQLIQSNKRNDALKQQLVNDLLYYGRAITKTTVDKIERIHPMTDGIVYAPKGLTKEDCV